MAEERGEEVRYKKTLKTILKKKPTRGTVGEKKNEITFRKTFRMKRK